MSEQRRVGRDGPLVGAIGFGAMGLTSFYASKMSDEECAPVVQRAIELGATMVDSSDIYGPPMGRNERMLSLVLKDPEVRKKTFVATKFGNFMGPDGSRAIKGKPEYVREACEKSLKALGIDSIDLYYQHRVDRTIPIEDTWNELKKLKEEGKVKYLGISEATSEEIEKAHAVTPISACQIEFSPWTPDIRTNGILATCRKLGIAIIAYSPLGRGFLTGQYKTIDDLEPDDFRRHMPRFQGEAFAENLKLVEKLQQISKKKGCTPSQLALAWVLAQGDDFIPIPGTKKIKYLEENMEATKVKLSKEELDSIDQAIESISIKGTRYAAPMMSAGAF